MRRFVDTAAQGAAAVDNRHADFRFRRFALFEAIDRLPAGQAAILSTIAGRVPAVI
jgi:hypothetical protein